MNYKKNYLYVVSYSILSVITPLITAPYIARVLGTTGVGTYSYYYAIAYYFTLLAKMGLTNYGTRRIAEVKNDEVLLKQEFSSIYNMQLVVALFISVIYFALVFFAYGTNRTVGYVFGIWVVANVINVDWFLFGVERFKETSTRNMVVKLLEVIMVFVLIRKPDDVWKYCLIYSVGFLITYISFFMIGKDYLQLRGISLKDSFKHFKPCLLLMIPVIALSIYRSMDKVMLGILTDDMAQNGLYENAEKIIYALTMFISSLGQVMMPRMSSLLSEGKEEEVKTAVFNSISFICFITNAMCFGLLSISKSFVPIFYGVEFNQSAVLINYLAVTLIFIGWGNVVRTQYIIPKKRDDIYIKSVSLGAIINLLINAVLIPPLGAVGACIGTVVAEFVVPLYQSIAVKTEIDSKRLLLGNLKFSIYGLIMFLVLYAIQFFLGIGLKTMIIQMILGAIVYIVLSFRYISKNAKSLLFRRKRKGDL